MRLGDCIVPDIQLRQDDIRYDLRYFSKFIFDAYNTYKIKKLNIFTDYG